MRNRKGRSALTAVGILLGVAILFGVQVSNDTTNRGIERLLEDFTGRADVLVTATGPIDATMPVENVAKVAALNEVEEAVGSYQFIGSLQVEGERDPQSVFVNGIDLKQERKIQNFDLARGRFFSTDSGVVIPEKLATKAGVDVGGRVNLFTTLGPQDLKVVGILEDKGAGRLNQGDSIFASTESARKLTGVGEELRLISVILATGTDVDEWIAENQEAIGPGLDFENAETLASGFKEFLNGLQAGFTSFAAVALFIGAFLIYLTLSVAIVERTQLYGTLRALGATKGQIRRTVIVEAVVLGIVSTLAGLGFGLLIAKGLLTLVSGIFEIELEGLAVRQIAIVVSVVMGIVVTVGSSFLPAIRASRLNPVEALRGITRTKRSASPVWGLGLALAVAGFWLALRAESANLGTLGTFLILLGSVLLTPVLLRPLASILGRISKRVARGVGDIAVLHLVKETSRSGYTLALIMVVMAMIFSLGGIQSSFAFSIDSVLDDLFGADLTISGGGVRFPPEFEEELRGVDGVGDVTAIRTAATFVAREPGEEPEIAIVLILDPETYLDVEGFEVVTGTQAGAEEALRNEDSVLISESLSESSGLGVGDEIELKTVDGLRLFRIGATYKALFGVGDIDMGLAAGTKHLNAGLAGQYHLNTVPGVSVEQAESNIRDALGARYNLEMQTAADIKDEAGTQLGQFMNLLLAILLVAAVIGLLGLANTLAISVAQRTREIGVLRAIGTTRGQVRRMVLAESLTLGTVAFALSLPLGLLLSQTAVSRSSTAMGFAIEYVYPSAWVPFVAAFGIIVAVVAALAPARRAGKLEVVESLRFE